MKKVIDEYHKQFMKSALKKLELIHLEDYYVLASGHERSEQEARKMEKLEDNLRKQVVNCFKQDKRYELLFKSQLITDELPHFTKNPDDKEAIGCFQKFTTYFQGFFENRKNMYSAEAKSTAVSYRIVNQNLPRFIDNMRVFHKIMDTELIDAVADIQRQMSEIFGERHVEAYFELSHYTHVVTNSDIEIYNTLIGGRTLSNGIKLKGINEYVNEYNQKNSKDKTIHKLPKLKLLYKQILADMGSLSFIEEEFADDQQLLDAVNDVVTDIYEKVLKKEKISSLPALLQNITSYDLNGIFVTNGPTITNLSNMAYGDWTILKSCLEKEYDALSNKVSAE